MTSLRVGKLELYINHHNIAFQVKKYEKVRVVKAVRFWPFIVQDSLNNIKPASDSTSESDSDSDRVERFVESRSNYSELNDSDLSLVRLDMDGKGQESSEKTMCHSIIYT